MFFSYGSGLASAMFSFQVSRDVTSGSSLVKLLASLKDIPARLEARKEVEPVEFLKVLALRENNYNKKNYYPTCSDEDLFTGTYFLINVDEKFRRAYKRKPEQEAQDNCMEL